MEIDEMPLEEKYERLLNQMTLVWAEAYDFNKKQGTTDKWINYMADVEKKLLPYTTGLGKIFFKFIKKIAPGKTFKETVNKVLYDQQKWHNYSNLELSWISDREAIWKVKNCPFLNKYEELIQKTGFEISPKNICENDIKLMSNVFKEYGVELKSKIEESGCQIRIKLK